ncbi:MAG: hypothetical protein QOI01_56 [Mycobacterium sp.]|jgi:hypothetical protein|nr:hypothetical protein [Mycobacterium sp.]
MSFYVFKLDKLWIDQTRGKIPDEDVVTFTVFVDQLDRGHGSGKFDAMTTGSAASTTDGAADGGLAYPAGNLFNMSKNWRLGPLEVRYGENVSVVYTGTNTSDEQLSSLDTQKQDDLEIKILDYVAKKYVELILGGASDIGSALSGAFNQVFKDPIGALLDYHHLGPCNGVVFSGVVPFTGEGLDSLDSVAIPQTANATPPMPEQSTTSFTNTYTDVATHDPQICGPTASTRVTFSVFKLSFISVTWAIQGRFPSTFGGQYGPGLRQYGQPGTTISIKTLLGIRP